MEEEPARAVIYSLPQRFEIDRWQEKAGKGVRQVTNKDHITTNSKQALDI